MSSRLDSDSELFIDGLRGVAAMAVLITHAFDFGIGSVFGRNLMDNPENWRWLRVTMGYGAFGVWSFFVISGLCIHRSISRSIADGTFSWSRYALARATRIYPLFLVGLCLAVLAWYVSEPVGGGGRLPWHQVWSSLFMVQILTSSFPTFQTSWSLSNEMAYYIIWPLALILCRRNGARAFRVSVVIMLAAVAGILILWKVFHRMEQSRFLEGLWDVLVAYPVWAVGAWLAINWDEISARVTPRIWLFSMLLCVVAECVLVWQRFHDYPMWVDNWASWTSIPGLMLFIAGSRHARLSTRSWAPRVCRWLGQFSYPSFVLHFQLFVMLDWWLSAKYGGELFHRPILRSLILLAVVFPCVAAVGPFLERRVMAWRFRVLGGTTRDVAVE